QSFSYFTILSNLVVFVAYLVLTVPTAISLRMDRAAVPALPRLVGGMVLVAITITGLVYNFVLVPRNVALGEFTGGDLADVLVHTWVPLLTLGDWLLFAPKGRFRWWLAVVWLAAPAAYAMFAFVRAEVGPRLYGVDSRYPYFFLDAYEFGWATVWQNFLWLLVGFLILGLVFVLVDRLIGWLLGLLVGRFGRQGSDATSAAGARASAAAE